MRFNFFLLCLSALLFFSGCTSSRKTNTARTGIEQLLISNAVDQTITKTPLPDVLGKNVFVEEKYLDSVDKGYIVGSLRQKLLASGAHLVDAKEGSDITLEVFSGGVGTDSVDTYLGMPGLTVPGLPVELPEIRLYEKSSQFGTAKIGLAAYETNNGNMIYDGGTNLARADDSNWSVVGIGPFQDGTVRREVNRGTRSGSAASRVANAVDFSSTIR